MVLLPHVLVICAHVLCGDNTKWLISFVFLFEWQVLFYFILFNGHRLTSSVTLRSMLKSWTKSSRALGLLSWSNRDCCEEVGDEDGQETGEQGKTCMKSLLAVEKTEVAEAPLGRTSGTQVRVTSREALTCRSYLHKGMCTE